MNNYVVTFEFADNSKCSDSKKKVIEYINSYKNSSKLLDNTYWINSFKNIIGKNIPNI